MKKIFLFATASVILLDLVFPSCKKHKDQTTLQKLQHKWTHVNTEHIVHAASGDYTETVPAALGDFINFDSNGTETFQFNGQGGTNSYSLLSDTQILIGSDTFTIYTLTDTQLRLYIKYSTSATEYDENIIYLTR